jgi:protein-disulfide isomerase
MVLYRIRMDSTANTQNNYIIAGAIIIAGILISIGVFASRQPIGSGEQAAGAILAEAPIEIMEITEQDHIRGNRDAAVIMVEYSDIECPFCQQFHTQVKAVTEQYEPSQFAWVYRHFPLDQIHQHARRYAVATECVATLGGNEAFNKYLDVVVDRAAVVGQNRTNITNTELTQLAVAQGVQAAQFTACLTSEAAQQAVEADFQDGRSAGVSGTPYNVFVLREALSKDQRRLLEELFGQPGSLTVSPDNKKVALGGGLNQSQLSQVIDILLEITE